MFVIINYEHIKYKFSSILKKYIFSIFLTAIIY